jgi:hypothetical protein
MYNQPHPYSPYLVFAQGTPDNLVWGVQHESGQLVGLYPLARMADFVAARCKEMDALSPMVLS